MKTIIFLIIIAYIPMLMAMEKENEKKLADDIVINLAINPLVEQITKDKIHKTTISLYSEITNPLDDIVKHAVAKFKPIKSTIPIQIVEIGYLKYTAPYLRMVFGSNAQITTIKFPEDTVDQNIVFNYPATDAVISISSLHWLSKHKQKKLFRDIANNLTPQGQLIISIPGKPSKHHPLLIAFKELQKEPYYADLFPKTNLLEGYHYITERKAKRYLDKADLTPLEITPYTRPTIFKDSGIFKEWLGNWMYLLPAMARLDIDKRITAINKLADLYLKKHPANLDSTVSYTSGHILIHAQN